MTMNLYEVVASASGVSVSQAMKLIEKASLKIADPRTSPSYWKTLASADIRMSVDTSRAVKATESLTGLARELRNMPGHCDYFDSGDKLSLRYLRSSSTGSAFPYTDFCDFVIEYDPIMNAFNAQGSIFGVNVPRVSEPTFLFTESVGEKMAWFAVVRDFFDKSTKMCERYGSHNLDLYMFKLGNELNQVGQMVQFGKEKLPNYGMFRANDVQFSAWYARSTLGLTSIKFTPALGETAYPVSVTTFRQLIKALDNHVESHQMFANECIEAFRALS